MNFYEMTTEIESITEEKAYSEKSQRIVRPHTMGKKILFLPIWQRDMYIAMGKSCKYEGGRTWARFCWIASKSYHTDGHHPSNKYIRIYTAMYSCWLVALYSHLRALLTCGLMGLITVLMGFFFSIV